MAFWNLEQHGSRIALVAPGRSWTYGELAARADALGDLLPDGSGIGLLVFPPSVDAVALYLACLRGGRHAPLLVNEGLDAAKLESLVRTYQPEWIAAVGEPPVGYETVASLDGLVISTRDSDDDKIPPPHPDLALLLSTSGSTGSSKLVRLSARAIETNAEAIVRYLALGSDDRAITTLPLAYSFGLSILNSHLHAGASIILTAESPVSREFWSLASTHRITSLSGVPANFEMFRRLGLEQRGLSALRMLTQAGGRMRDGLTRETLALCRRQGWDLVVMYGQTEAAPRISYLPPHRLEEKIGSIGISIPGGELSVDTSSGELVYRGPNVMLGYAETRLELTRGDELGGVLRTGDLATIDDEGFAYITGRTKRMIKLSGHRISLDELETAIADATGGACACTGIDDALGVVVTDGSGDVVDVPAMLQTRFRIHPSLTTVVHAAELPRLPSGKPDYAEVQRQITGARRDT